MSAAAQPALEAGRAYRTEDLARWGTNPGRLARRLVREGRLREAARGLYYAPVPSKFGLAPAADQELLRAFLDDEPYLISGPPRWNTLRLGATALFAATLVYNARRSGDFTIAGRPFVLRREAFPEHPTPEWFVVDLFDHHDMAGVALSELRANLVATLRLGRWDAARLRSSAEAYGTTRSAALIDEAIQEAGAP